MNGILLALVLAGFGLVAGIGTTAVGPGGVLATVGLFLVSGLAPAEVAGTAIVTHVATGALGSAAYLRSGQLRHPARLLACVGLGVAVASGMLGVGGPLLTVPLLVVAGTPVLPALAAAQVQSVVVSGLGTLGYLSRGAVDWPLALMVGIPELGGVLIGWRVARSVPPSRLKQIMIAALLAAACTVVIRG